MFDSNPHTPLIGIKGANLNLIQINFDNSENSTRESNHSQDNLKSFEDTIEIKDEQKNAKTQGRKKFSSSRNKNAILNKKTKREKNQANSSKKNNNKIKNGKYKIILNLFNEFKSSSKLYKEFTQFHYIEKNVKNNLYSSVSELATEIRNIFSQIFSSFKDPENYNKIFIFCELFENIYKKYDNKTMTKKCKNLSEVINKLKKELRQTMVGKNISVDKTYNNNINNSFYLYSSSKNKFKLELKDSDSEAISELSVKKYKNDITDKIKRLNNEQKRGILGIISNNCIDKNTENNVMEINVNKMTINQMKQLDKYVNECINNYSISSPHEKKSEFSNIKFFEEEKECDILKNDDLSSCLSDDEDEEDDE